MLKKRGRHLIDAFLQRGEGYAMEFGVFKGDSITCLANSTRQEIYGFDSFQGLPEDWKRGSDVYSKGHFRVDKTSLTVPMNVTLIEGFFEDSLEPWLADNPDKVGFLHIDCDLYSAAKYVLDTLNDRIYAGTVIVFDEYKPISKIAKQKYPLWREGEYKAFQKWLKEHNRECRMLAKGQHYEYSFLITK